jgi:hypothetical protein
MLSERMRPGGRVRGRQGEAAVLVDGDREREDLETVVRSWRFEQFVRLGFNTELSSALAASRVDLSQVRRLIQSGCPPETASRIVL